MSLNNLAVVITRAKPRADSTIERFEKAGAKVIYFPVMQIEPIKIDSGQLNKIPDHTIIIFTSQNAAQYSISNLSLNSSHKIVAIGEATADWLKSQNISVTAIAPEPYTSESLLTLSLLKNIQHKKIIIISGEGGRDLLQAELTKHGAVVRKVAVYRRIKNHLKLDNATWQQWQSCSKLIITAFSYETLEFLWRATETNIQSALAHSAICVINQRQVQLASQLGFKGEILIAENASEEAVFKEIMSWYTDASFSS